MKQFKKITK